MKYRPKQWVAYGRGFSGDYRTMKEAEAIVKEYGDGALYVRIDMYAGLKLAEAVLATVPGENNLLHRLARRVKMMKPTPKGSYDWPNL